MSRLMILKNMRNSLLEMTHDSINKPIYGEGLEKPMYQTDSILNKNMEKF